ncbi:MAG: undecaprenyl/decaprenyl-phosphate alpha-N-acetylglucosaminyl 1-phosphate transferase [Bacteroidetes bacterium]|nr:undecaprenyl/decaprenyl-phosphate alpha-N-acetylglucosaminyl 1-phosphate transferase [Bacteroidota bacterium]
MLIIGGTFIFSVLVNGILLKFAQTLGIRQNIHRQIRWNPSVRPSLGGISFYLTFLLTFIFLFMINNVLKLDFSSIRLIGILIVCSLAFMMGLADDAYNTQPLLKLITQLVCGLVLIFTGTSIDIFENEFINYGLTILWVVGFMNSINMLDNMDAITTIVSIAILTFVIVLNISLKTALSPLPILSIGILGALTGFLVFNWHPAKMFMGDTGSQFLGVFLAILGIKYCWNVASFMDNNWYCINPVFIGFVAIIGVFILPITDTVTVTINRIRRGSSPFVGGKDHTTHHLFFKGITEKRIAILYALIGAFGAFVVLEIILNYQAIWIWLSIIFSALTFVSLYLNTIIQKRK